MESGMETMQDSARRIRVPPRYELYAHHGCEERYRGIRAFLRSIEDLGGGAKSHFEEYDNIR